MAQFLKGKKTGMVMKTNKTKSHFSKAGIGDIKGMSTKQKIKFGTAVKAQSKSRLGKKITRKKR